jgi:hypothetical protein
LEKFRELNKTLNEKNEKNEKKILNEISSSSSAPQEQEQEPEQKQIQKIKKVEELIDLKLNPNDYDTEHIHTLFKYVNDNLCLIPKYKDPTFTLCEPLSHPIRAKQTHEWLAKLGTYKFLDVIEEVNINSRRIEQLAAGFPPLTTKMNDPPDLLETTENERQEKSCPLLIFRDLGNGCYAFVNVNDMQRASLDHTTLTLCLKEEHNNP